MNKKIKIFFILLFFCGENFLFFNSSFAKVQFNTKEKKQEEENKKMSALQELSFKIKKLMDLIKRDIENTLYESAKERCKEVLKLLKEESNLIDELLEKTKDKEKIKVLFKKLQENEKNVREIKEILALLQLP